MARGDQILIDRSEAMLPFREDTRRVQTVLIKTFGADSLSILHFANNPMRGTGTGPRRRWKPYHELGQPIEGTRVLVISDLGIGYCAQEVASENEEWLNFAECVARRNCPLTILTPYGPDRWPRLLDQRLKIVHWDSATTSATVSRMT